jgi:hypothetical protein
MNKKKLKDKPDGYIRNRGLVISVIKELMDDKDKVHMLAVLAGIGLKMTVDEMNMFSEYIDMVEKNGAWRAIIEIGADIETNIYPDIDDKLKDKIYDLMERHRNMYR